MEKIIKILKEKGIELTGKETFQELVKKYVEILKSKKKF